MLSVYPNLISEVAKRGIKKTVISARLGISNRTLYNKMNGSASFTWEEICGIQQCFFPDIEKDILFAKQNR